MSGHNKWSQIKNKKAVTDSKRSKIFSKIVRLINMEARKSSGNINSPGLRNVIEKAKAVNMPSDNIERAIKKAGTEGGTQMESITYEGYGPGGVGIVIDALTDNRNRTAQEIKFILSKNSCSLGAIGSVTWNFKKKENNEWIPNDTIDLNDEDLVKLEKVIEELEDSDDIQGVFTNAE